MKKKTLLIFIILIVLLGIGGLYWKQTTPKLPQTLQKVTIRLNWLNQAQYAGIYIAQEKGFYQQNGLDVKIKEYVDGLDQTAEVATGGADFAISTGVETLSAIAKGQNIIAIAAIHQISPQAIAVLKSSNITLPPSFKGKKLGAKGGNQQAKVTYNALLNSVGLKSTDVQIIDLDYSVDVDKDLTQHRADTVDLYRTNEPYLLDKEGIAYNLILPENFGVSTYGDVIVTSPNRIKTNEDMVEKFIKATVQGWEYATTHEDEALKITAKYANKLYQDPQQEKFIFEKSLPLIKPTGDRPIGIMDFITWDQTAKQLQTAGTFDTKPDVSSIYTNKYVSK
jgi:ABC-type nitrate/sulfonate/bicarbonate transport system substrate-binding protein